jgi:hypothetical protein
MKKFSNWEEKKEVVFNLDTFIENLVKENTSIEISNVEKPYDDIELKTNDELSSKIRNYIEEEIIKSNISILEKIKLAYFQNNTLDVINDTIEELREKLK